MAEQEINITYETLFDLLRREKSREDLQKLENTFFSDVISYLKEKKQMLIENKEKLGEDSGLEAKRISLQIDNINKILKEFYEKRERKIINLAMLYSRTNHNMPVPDTLLDEEKGIFNSITNILDTSRTNILESIINLKMPEEKKQDASANNKIINAPKDIDAEKSTKVVRFISAVPKFLGTNLETYGPFEEDDVAKLPAKLAETVIIKERAEEICSD